MEPAVAMRDVGVRFRVPRRSHLGKTPRLFGSSRWTLWGLRHVSLEVAPGEVVGLIGPNGSGKTTLLRTVAGIYLPDEGEVTVGGRVGPVLSLTAGLENDLSGWDNVMLSGVLLGLSVARTRAILPDVAEMAGLGEFMDAPVRVYSSGMKARLGFAVAMFADPDVLLLDEIFSVGDEEFRRRSTAKMQEMIAADRSVLMASHQLDSVSEICNRLVRLEEGRVVEVGDPQTVARDYVSSRRVKA
jgi:homopolymeric O-antigen transport system ATP-binding protein